MTKEQKTGLALLGAAALTGIGVWGYSQYQKLMNYSIGFVGIKPRAFGKEKISFDLTLSYLNNSDVDFYILKQDYKVFVNNRFVSKITGVVNPATGKADTIVIKHGIDPQTGKKYINPLPINVTFTAEDVAKAVGKNWTALLLAPEKVIIRTEMKFRVGISILGAIVPIPITYPYEVSLKEIISWYKPAK